MHDPGGKVRLALPPGITGGAEFSDCGRYRRTLWRAWLGGRGEVLFIGMNPSTADAEVDDPTVRREIGFAQRWGFSRLIKCNLGDYRATHPRDLPRVPEEACTEANLEAIKTHAIYADLVVMAHGVPPAPLRETASIVAKMIREEAGQEMVCLGLTKEGFPKHPLYVRGDTSPIAYSAPPQS